MLPKVEYSTKVTVKLPSGRTARLRPFAGGEERILLYAKMANSDSDKYNAILDIAEACSEIPREEINTADLEVIFLKLYEISIGDKIKTGIRCSCCGHSMQVSIPTNSIKIPKTIETEHKIDPIPLENGEEAVIVLRPPAMHEIVEHVDDKDMDLRIIWASLEGVYIAGEKQDITFEEFSPWLLSAQKAYGECLKYVQDMPKISFKKKWKCPECGEENETVLEGLKSFFTS